MIAFDLLIVVAGLASGSFIHTMSARLPKGESVWGRSRCDACSRPIPVADLIPLFGYLARGGKCRWCEGAIPAFYPAVEVFNAIFVYSIYLQTGWSAEFFRYALVFEALLLIAILDSRTYLIFPQPILFGLLVQTVWLCFGEKAEIAKSLLGLLLGAGIFYWIGYLYQTIRKRVGLGDGDAALAGLIGYVFGFNFLLPVIFWGAVFGIVGGGGLLLAKRESLNKRIAFGPWLVLATFLTWRFSDFFLTIPFKTNFNPLAL